MSEDTIHPAKGSVSLTAFSEALERKRAADGLTVREMCRQIGVAPTVYYRMVRGNHVGIDNFTVMCRWLGEPPGQFLGLDDNMDWGKWRTETGVLMLLSSDPVLEGAKDAVMAVLAMARKNSREDSPA